MNVVLKTAPTLDPITLVDAKLQCRVDSEIFDGNVTTSQSILPGSHGVSAGGLYTHVGAAVEVLGKTAIVNLNAGTVGAGGTVDAKIEDSDDNTTWAAWTGGAFTQVTAANDNAIQEKAYTGVKRYVRVTAKVLVAGCEFGADVIVNAATTPLDAFFSRWIKTATKEAEDLTSRKFLTQTWYYYPQEWPDGDAIKIPFGNLQSVTSVKWKDSDGTETTLTAGTDYLEETNGDGIGRIVLPAGVSWPSASPYPSNPICIEFVCGWTAAASIPEQIVDAVLLGVEKLYDPDRDEKIDAAIKNLLRNYRLWDEF